jgi:DNA-binding transcriptional ArsR family regulator
MMIDKCAFIDNKLLPFFYIHEERTLLILLMNDVWEDIADTDKDIIGKFYNILRDTDKITQYIVDFYFPKLHLNIDDFNFIRLIREEIFQSDLPSDVKLYLFNYIVYSKDDTEKLIEQIQKTQILVEELYKIHSDDIDELRRKFSDNRNISNLCQMLTINLTQFNIIYYTYCTIYYYSITIQQHKESWLLILGINSEKTIYAYMPACDINLYELGRILFEETRLNILKMLTGKEMYCAEIAKELGLKNNSTIYHLSMMLTNKLLKTRLIGNKVMYKINDEYLNNIKKLINDILEKDAVYHD